MGPWMPLPTYITNTQRGVKHLPKPNAPTTRPQPNRIKHQLLAILEYRRLLEAEAE